MLGFDWEDILFTIKNTELLFEDVLVWSLIDFWIYLNEQYLKTQNSFFLSSLFQAWLLLLLCCLVSWRCLTSMCCHVFKALSGGWWWNQGNQEKVKEKKHVFLSKTSKIYYIREEREKEGWLKNGQMTELSSVCVCLHTTACSWVVGNVEELNILTVILP